MWTTSWARQTENRYREYKIRNDSAVLRNLFWKLYRVMWEEGGSVVEYERLYDRGLNYIDLGKLDAAGFLLGNFLIYKKDIDKYWHAFGVINQRKKEYAKAIEAYDRAIACNESDVASYIHRAESQILCGNTLSALKDLEKVLEIGREQPELQAWVDRAELLLKRNKLSLFDRIRSLMR